MMEELLKRTRQAATYEELDKIEHDSFSLSYIERQQLLVEVGWRYRQIGEARCK